MAYQLPALRLAFDNNSPEVIGVLLATGLLCGVGALDDRFELDALTKLAGQITAAGVLVLFGVQWVVFWVPWGGGASGSFLILGQEQGVLLTVLLAVALVNAMNFVDGLDGLAAGIGLISAGATGLFAIGLVQRVGNDPSAYSPALLAAVLAGACLGFLPHNFNPARIFMGDSGSMLIGLMLAAATTSESGRIFINGETGTGAGSDLLALFAPVVVLAAVVFVPLLDLLMAVVRRTRKGLSPFTPDKMHLHHRLLEIGHSHRRAVLLIYLWAGVLAFGAVALALIDDPFVVLWSVGIGLVVAVLATAVPRARQPS
jgi:UDP-GlcNAc:undecaprenyl-phosphate/decaprenyl-phosphate GlcNAc-1-phosphate transferase